jgi:alpha-mannosidase
VALLTDCKYGYSTFDNTMRISLLRSPKSPDPKADMGKHEFAFAIMPHSGGWREAGVVAEGFRFNMPLQWAKGALKEYSFMSVDDPNLVLDTVKKAEDSDAMVIRLYEAHGSRGTARLRVGLPFSSAVYCNILEEDGQKAKVIAGQIEVPYKPFQIITLKLK